MVWQFTLGVLLVVNVCSLTFSKVATDMLPKNKSVGIFWQYLFCAMIAAVYALVSGITALGLPLLLVAAVGFFNAFGNYCQWQAFGLSFSRSSLFFPLMEVWTISLALLFLGETPLWNIQLILGAALCFAAMWLFRISGKKELEKKEAKSIPAKRWFAYTVGMIAVFGTAAFLLKLFSFTIPRETFLMGFYLGAFLGSLPILCWEKQNPFRVRVSSKTFLTIIAVAVLAMGATLMLYWTYQLGGPISLVQPVRGTLIALSPVLLGWFAFKERKSLTKTEWFAFFLGIAGAVLVLLR